MQTFKLFYLWLLLLPVSLIAQQEVSGTVTDESGLPIPGVNILVENTDRGTVTDFDGNYALEVSEGEILVFSYLGYQTQKVAYQGQDTLNVSLKTESESLEEVVLVGYGTSTKKELTGSVSSLQEKDFTKGNIVTPENLIQGRAAGVNVTTGGAPGSGSAIRIRGGGSLDSNQEPLIVIDGLPLSNSTTGGSRSILSTINPNDIKSFNILKDAAATAIYGNRASGGVIIIETKDGGKEFKVDFNYQMGVYDLPNKIDVFSADEFRSIISEQRPNDVGLLGDANTDWQEEIYRVATSTDQNVSVRGKLFDFLPARISLGHRDQDGLRRTSNFTRSTASLSLNPSFFDDRLRVSLNVNGSFVDNRFADAVEGAAIRFDPTQPVRQFNSPFGGFFEYFNRGSDGTINRELGTRNPVASLVQRRNESEVERFYGNFKIDYRFSFLESLRAVINLGFDDESGEGSNVLSRESINGIQYSDGSFNGSANNFTNDQRNTLFDAYLVYNEDITDRLNVNVRGGYSYQKFEREGFNSGELRDEDQVDFSNTFTDPELILIAYFGRAEVKFDQKYILSGSIRRDGTSRFGEGQKWGTFPAASFAYNITEENFLEDSEFLSNLKLRAGYGETGQQEIGPKILGIGSYVQSQPVGQVILGGQPFRAGFPVARNDQATWETAKTINAGIDFGFFNDRLTGSVDVYDRDTENLFVNAAVPDGSNFTNQIDQNSGTLNTQGLEVSLNALIADNNGEKDQLRWDLSYNVTFIDQEIEELANGQDIRRGGIEGGTGSNVQLLREGFAPNQFFVFNQVYDNNGQPIEGAYADLNGDNIINDDDRYLYRKPQADVTMGLQSSMNYQGFDFTFNMRASLGNYLYNNVNSARAQFDLLRDNAVLGNIPTQVLETRFDRTADVLLSDLYIEDASFLRIDNVQLGYTFEDFFNQGESLRIYGGVQNVYTFTDYSGLDPEVFGGIDNTIFPRARTVLLGANVKF
jgi:iron complex outermembrane receptor protein